MDTLMRYWPLTIQTSMSWNIVCFSTTLFFSLYLMGHILIFLRSACLCAVLIFSSSLMHCCIIYIPLYNKPPLPSTDTKPYFTRSHSPWRDRKDRSYSRCCRFVGNGKTSWMPHPDTPSMAQAVWCMERVDTPDIQ